MRQVVIICRQPGFRRCGVAHPAREVYAADRWSDDELAILEAEPMLEVERIGSDDEAGDAGDGAEGGAAGQPRGRRAGKG